MRTPLGGLTPAAWRQNWLDVRTSRRGITPSATISPGPYTSARNASRARTRWATPASMTAHSAAGMIRGTRSSGNGRSSPESEKVMP